jgi:tetratricopeptide (TPR) repeat protein
VRRRHSGGFRTSLIGLVLLAACGSTAGEHETLGDRAYAARHFAEALVEYRIALRQGAPNAGLRAKAAMAALKAGDLEAAAEEYVKLAEEGGQERLGEAAEGLERVARAAVRQDDRSALAKALAGLRQLASGRALGAFAVELVRAAGADPSSGETLNILPYAAASAPDARQQDSLMYLYGLGLARRGRCPEALPVLESLIRRRREPAVVAPAEREVARCAWSLGQRALDDGQPQEAEEWFRRAAGYGGGGSWARAAYIGLGDVLFARGDYAGAAGAYQQAMIGAEPGDSLAAVAAEKLNSLANAGVIIR